MWHRKFDREGNQTEGCGGRVLVDRAFSNENWLELACIECGKRWLLDALSNALARTLVRKELRFVNAGNR